MLGGVLQLAVQVPALARIGCLPRIGLAPARASRAAWRHPGVRRVLRQMAPALLGVSVAQISLLINTQIASHAGRRRGVVADLRRPADGVPDRAARRRARRGAAAAAVGRAGARATPQRYSAHARLGPAPGAAAGAAVRGGAAGVPAAAGRDAVPLRRASTRCDVAQTALALLGYGVGLLGLVGVKVLAPGFYARQDMRTPVRIAVVVLVAHAGAEPGVRAAARPCRAGAVDRPRRADQRRLAAASACGARGVLPAGAGLGRASRCRSCSATLRWARCWPGPRARIDWIGLRPASWLRVGLLAAVPGRRGAAVLRRAAGAAACDLREFMRRG